MSFILMACFLALFSGSVALQSDTLTRSFTSMQASPSPPDCNATCATYFEYVANCKVPQCGCAVPFLQAQGECLVCKTSTPRDAAAVQFLLNDEISQCRNEGINVAFQLDLPPSAAMVVQKVDRDSASLRRFQVAFLALQIAGGHIGLVVLLAFALFSRKVHRDPTFFNFCMTWVFYSLVFSMLSVFFFFLGFSVEKTLILSLYRLYRGTDGNTVINPLGQVSPNLCLAQAILTNGAQVMTACSTMTFVIQFWLCIRTAIYRGPISGISTASWTTVVLLVAPYILFIAFALPSALIGTSRFVVEDIVLERIMPTNFYCTVVGANALLKAVYSVTLALLIVTAIFKALIISVLFRHWRMLRHIKTKNHVSPHIFLRIAAFSLYRVVVAVAYVMVLHSPPKMHEGSPGNGASIPFHFTLPIWVDMLQAAIPLVGFLVLGLNSDTVNSFMFWRRFRPRNIPPVHSVNATSISAINSEPVNEEKMLKACTSS
ncbi:hypothetical protein JB92DRAFT_3103931 [Gautieria morchelliformis]|nr:hypothetical protein JB92DRAFT_3103931 [Gautieria morchelliformis]